MKFATDVEIEINRLLEGEPVSRYLPDLDGTETSEEILNHLRFVLIQQMDVRRLSR
jgi:hypothetical protein